MKSIQEQILEKQNNTKQGIDLLAMAYIKIKSNNYMDAIRYCNQSLQYIPRQAAAHFLKGCAYYGLKQYQEALKALDEAIRIDPELTNARYYKGQVLEAMNRQREAQEIYQEIRRRDPDYLIDTELPVS